MPESAVPGYLRAIQAGYLIVAGASLIFAMLWMSSPGFRYWLFVQGRQLQYRWALYEYNLRREPIPAWVQQMATEQNLPHEE